MAGTLVLRLAIGDASLIKSLFFGDSTKPIPGYDKIRNCNVNILIVVYFEKGHLGRYQTHSPIAVDCQCALVSFYQKKR